MRRLSVLQLWQRQQQTKFDDIKHNQSQLHQHHQSHQQRLDLLESLPESYVLPNGNQSTALVLKGIGRFRNQIDGLVRLQRQELALSEVEIRALDERLIEQHRQVKLAEVLVSKREKLIQARRDKQEQKMLDDLSMQRCHRVNR